MKNKGLFFLIVMLIGFSGALFAQDVQPPADIKEFWELKKWTVILGGLLALIGLLKNTGLDKKLETHWIGRLVLSTINLILTFAGKRYSVYKAKRAQMKAARASAIPKLLLIGLLMASASFTAAAQDGFLRKLIDPVTKERIVQKQQMFRGDEPAAEASAWFPRGAVMVSGVKFHHSTEAEKWITEDFMRAGAGIEFAHYRVLNDVMINDYGIGGYFLPPVDGDPTQQYVSVLLNGSVYDLGYRFKLDFLDGVSVGMGVCYDINKAVPAKDNISFVPNLKITF